MAANLLSLFIQNILSMGAAKNFSKEFKFEMGPTIGNSG